MDRKIFIANWKAHKTPDEVFAFFENVNNRKEEINFENKIIVIAPPFPLLPIVKENVEKYNLSIEICAQDVSMLGEGPYTGEVSAKLIKSYGNFTIIGHSERRDNFKENDEVLFKKAELALGEGINPIYCVQNETQNVPEGIKIVAFEPPSAIGTGNPDDPAHIAEVFGKIKEKYSEVRVLYGGSVNRDNISSFLDIPNLSGFLVGGASLEPDTFISLLSQW